MRTFHISLNDIPPEGRAVVIDDPLVWEQPLAEFHIDCRVVTPLRAEASLLPAGDGCLVRGTLSGSVIVPCDRCAEDAHVLIDHHFETFETIPEQSEDGDGNEAVEDDATYITLEQGVPVLDLAGLCWEEFMLALPVKPLCQPDCKGLCASCGVNLNTGACTCPEAEGDPRLAALRAFKVKTPDR